MFFLLVDTGQPALAMLALALALARGGSVGIMFGIQGVVLSELFSTASREFAAILFGGFAPLIAVSLTARGGSSRPVGIYVVVLATITFASAWSAPETYRSSLSDTRDV